jgi:hypothetical protein
MTWLARVAAGVSACVGGWIMDADFVRSAPPEGTFVSPADDSTDPSFSTYRSSRRRVEPSAASSATPAVEAAIESSDQAAPSAATAPAARGIDLAPRVPGAPTPAVRPRRIDLEAAVDTPVPESAASSAASSAAESAAPAAQPAERGSEEPLARFFSIAPPAAGDSPNSRPDDPATAEAAPMSADGPAPIEPRSSEPTDDALLPSADLGQFFSTAPHEAMPAPHLPPANLPTAATVRPAEDPAESMSHSPAEWPAAGAADAAQQAAGPAAQKSAGRREQSAAGSPPPALFPIDRVLDILGWSDPAASKPAPVRRPSTPPPARPTTKESPPRSTRSDDGLPPIINVLPTPASTASAPPGGPPTRHVPAPVAAPTETAAPTNTLGHTAESGERLVQRYAAIHGHSGPQARGPSTDLPPRGDDRGASFGVGDRLSASRQSEAPPRVGPPSLPAAPGEPGSRITWNPYAERSTGPQHQDQAPEEANAPARRVGEITPTSELLRQFYRY